jgi:hypothetical protein
MKDIKTFRPKQRVTAFRYEAPEDLPDGWTLEKGTFDYVIAPDGFYLSIDFGDWVVCKDGIWGTISNWYFEELYEECES